MAEPLLRVDRLVKKFGDRTAVGGVSLEVAEGEIVVVIGPSGCGKTTLLRCVNHLEQPTAGHVYLRGESIGGVEANGQWTPFSENRLAPQRRRIGFVFQRFNLFPTLTVRGNLEIARQIQGKGVPPKAELVEMLELVGLPHKMDMKPLDLSAGEQQRIAIARALINRPAIVLADEPTGNLDSVNSAMILDLFRNLNGRLGQTLVMITHNLDAAGVAHRTVEMKDGRVVSHGLVPRLASGAPS